MNTSNVSSTLVIILLAGWASANTNIIQGKVRNGTTGRPSAGDEVILLRMGSEIHDETHTRTNVEGSFTLLVSVPDAPHLVRIIHQGVSNDQMVSGSAPLNVTVFDTVQKIAGVGGNLGIAVVESDGSNLKITEMYAITNDSAPPVTQAGENGFKISLPAKADLDWVRVKGPGDAWAGAQPALQNSRKGLYTLNVPLRPGDTLFKFAYHLPYTGTATIRLSLAYPIRNFAVMHPKSLSFAVSRPGTFRSPGMVNGLQLEQAVSQPLVGVVPAFTVSGVGIAPPNPREQRAAPVRKAPGRVAPPSVVAPQGNEDSVWLALAALGSVLAFAGLILFWWRKRSGGRALAGELGFRRPMSTVNILKQKLFELEIRRLEGRISAEEYAARKSSSDQNLLRMMAKQKNTR